MDFYREPTKELPVKEYDVVIVGGGTAGVIAAIASARSGAKTVLVEMKGYVGGTMLEGGTTLHSFFSLGKAFDRPSVQLVRGIPQELIDRLVAVGGSTGHLFDELGYAYDERCTLIDVESYKQVAAQMLLEAGVSIYFCTLLSTAEVHNGHIQGIVVQSRAEGRLYLKGKSFIDATGWGDLSYQAGAECIYPKEYSLANSVGVGGIDVEKYSRYLEENHVTTGITYGPRDGKEGQILRLNAPFYKVLSTLMQTYRANNKGAGGYAAQAEKMLSSAEADPNTLPIELQREIAKQALTLTFTTMHKDYFMYLKVNHMLKGSIEDQKQMTLAEINLRNKQKDAIDLLRKYIPGCENAFIARTSPTLCTRRGRVVVCDYDISNDDILKGRHFEDDIAYFGFHDNAPKMQVGGDGSYGIPLRALLVKGIDNLFAVGMMLSTQYDAYMSTRNTVCCMAQGQAAGSAAALCALENSLPRELSYGRLKRQLLSDKVYLGEKEI